MRGCLLRDFGGRAPCSLEKCDFLDIAMTLHAGPRMMATVLRVWKNLRLEEKHGIRVQVVIEADSW